ncbi:TPA: PTS system mannose/fructose/N-acetylgalactosamine-transporter subunit IIB [Citrobacter farmeri]|uniref:PTS system mannose/fructose/N-acetylgalactosamine-transporter subunit IIB n=1 Tax=Citrobacter farmeri TaxID=67824 RepID=UPI000F689185|nr:PTS sugar transporter subunit IIB [Citrobacter farmeri]RSB14212.1 PTS mannose/fructose/sorbose transporter subunit IIB [Citrobacter farmeri]HEM6631583.1 PTS sugar transporter subunit IIB [Citrobacter farmeri]HEM6744325.1 PTS sugar transporter subunit IIB [Citrobacter farmeri]
MISLVRIDDRLIHGQVAVVWTKHLGVNRILVANDQIVNNDVQKMSLRMAAPDTVKCAIMAVKDAGDVLNDPRSEAMKIMVIVNNAADARRLVEQVAGIKALNVANFGRITDNLAAKKRVSDTVYVTPEDVTDFRAIADRGVKVDYQVLPSHPVKNLIEMLDNAAN